MQEDLKYIFHPCTQMKDHEKLPLIPIQKGKGAYIYDYDGGKYLDCISSWWVNLFGHSNKYINKKLHKQSKKLEHVIFAGFTHKPAIKLARRLVNITPKPLQKVFFADNGSSAVEISLKMAFQYFKNKGESRPLFISLTNSYHGETMGALAVSDTGLYKDIYTDILLKTIQAKSPAIFDEQEALNDMESKLKEYEGKVSSIIVEPLIQCAGSMKMYKPSYLVSLRKLCDKYGVFLIADEVAVGFGRTGTMFAVEQANISPDFLCLSKGITAGYLPLSVVLFTDDIYNAFYCDYNEGKSFLDSHSYTGNTLACAVANASLDIFEKDNVIEENQIKIDLMKDLTQKFKSLDNVLEVRQTGMICTIELKGYKSEDRIGLKIFQEALKHGVYIRPLGHIIYFMPPYIFTKKQIKKMIDTTYKVVSSL
ncbi:MAG: adenosylmethionine--8-amino-7-oxononanoate transaminase [Campylobacteraceae bacterium]|nr:adenosylmethionine--8-amino-7-oxononanoate transaminase [Campylobacteraceae bacterium]MBT4179391.1 adenosylmethionine--8-amino-7-oxononanoate transaminase [Campylobacteraceae bacterium]MBT5983185.1 adenosylmethionine--8-amino-7-oxononanoate transaminase [Campylobacteraceae bacterium]MBT7274561.1 adenosylmethionine--8-amino-7-oxononanoate transaminase [Campylobacteraceae bacterium]